MGQFAPRVTTTSDAIRALEAIITELPGNARVEVTLKDGKKYAGIVCVRPTIQMFRDKDGVEGANGVLRLEDTTFFEGAAPGGDHRIWLDEITHVRKLDAISGTFGG